MNRKAFTVDPRCRARGRRELRSPRPAGRQENELLRDQRQSRQGRRSRRARGRRQVLPGAGQSQRGAGKRTWRAYLSTTAKGGGKAVNARDRIGKGPWYNAKGELIAKNVDALHDSNDNLTKQTLLTEKGHTGQWSRRHAEHARHPDRLGFAGPRPHRRYWRHDVQQLDQRRRRRLRNGRPQRPPGPAHRCGGEIVECHASLARLQHAAAESLGWRWNVLLLRGQVTTQCAGHNTSARQPPFARSVNSAMAGPTRNFWDKRFAEGNTPWDRGAANPQLGAWLAAGALQALPHPRARLRLGLRSRRARRRPDST